MSKKLYFDGRMVIMVLSVTLAVFATGIPAKAGKESSLHLDLGSHARGGRHTPGWLRDAVSAWDKGRKSRAVGHARRALRRQPMDFQERAIAVHMLCVGQTELGKVEKALRYCDEAVEIERDEKWLHHNNRANARLKLGDVEGAILDYERAVLLMKFDESRRVEALEGSHSFESIVRANLARARQRAGGGVEGIAAATRATRSAPGEAAVKEVSAER